MKEVFVEHKFSTQNIEMIYLINQILDEYKQQGYKLSLRQLYYQLVSRDYVPNTQRSYKNVGSLVSNARQAGEIDWEMIEDRNRETRGNTHWNDPGEIIEACARQFMVYRWENQPYHIEVMVEKDALSGVLEPVCRDLDVGITANKGYSSSSTMYEIGQRLRWKELLGKKICILYLGDHDPSGIDMTRDIEERLRMYSRIEDIEVVRLALNWDQIKMWRPPENPAKETDARYENYVSRYGNSSWELDAVEPVQLANLVREAILSRRDSKKWKSRLTDEKHMKDKLLALASTFNNQE